jgi:mono/diheme cytochrome c family protein
MKYSFLFVFSVVTLGGAFATRTGNAVSIAASDSTAASYAKYCASCHGSDGRAKTAKGKRNHARSFADLEWQNRVSDERIFNSIMNGKGKMPGYGKKLSEQVIDSLASYVRTLRG